MWFGQVFNFMPCTICIMIWHCYNDSPIPWFPDCVLYLIYPLFYQCSHAVTSTFFTLTVLALLALRCHLILYEITITESPYHELTNSITCITDIIFCDLIRCLFIFMPWIMILYCYIDYPIPWLCPRPLCLLFLNTVDYTPFPFNSCFVQLRGYCYEYTIFESS